MPAITLPGLSSGIDTSAIIGQLVDVARNPVRLLQQRQATWNQRSQAFNTLQTRLNSLQTVVDDLRSASALRAYDATSSSDSIVTVEADSGASEGAHQIVVNRLASAEREVHDGVAALDTQVGAGTFTYEYNGTKRTLQTTADTTLEGLRDLVNYDAGNPGATASLLQYDADHLGTQVYHLVLSGNDSGSDYAITVVDGETTLDGTGGTVDFRTAAFTTTQNAQDSQVRVDGYPATDWIERSTNTLTDVIPGVTLHLHATTAVDDPVRVSLNRNTTDLKEKLKGLVTAYNGLVDYADQQTAYDAAAKTAGVLMGEYTLTFIRHALRLPLAEGAPGFKDGSDPFSLAAQIGLSVDKDGHLKLDQETLDDAISDNYLGVLSLLGAANSGASDSEELRFYGATSATQAGLYDVRAVFTDGVLESAQIKLSTESEWRDAAVEDGLIMGASGHPEELLQIAATHAGSGTVTAQVRVRQGIGGRLYDQIQDIEDNALKLSKQRCTDASALLQKRIDEGNDRVTRFQERLKLQYARLEQALTLIQAQQQALATMTAS